MSAFAVALLPIAAFAFRADVATNRTMATLMPDCSAWYENLPGKFKAKFGWTSADRKEYITKSPDPCAAVGLECCEGHCGLEGCEKELECLECRAKLAGVPGEVQKEICEDSQTCSSRFFNDCVFLAGECTRKKQPCDKCTKSYSQSGHEVAKAACENRELCYLPQIGTYKEGGCIWNDEHGRCDRGASERHEQYKEIFGD